VEYFISKFSTEDEKEKVLGDLTKFRLKQDIFSQVKTFFFLFNMLGSKYGGQGPHNLLEALTWFFWTAQENCADCTGSLIISSILCSC
jgi:hypothetical protein